MAILKGVHISHTTDLASVIALAPDWFTGIDEVVTDTFTGQFGQVAGIVAATGAEFVARIPDTIGDASAANLFTHGCTRFEIGNEPDTAWSPTVAAQKVVNVMACLERNKGNVTPTYVVSIGSQLATPEWITAFLNAIPADPKSKFNAVSTHFYPQQQSENYDNAKLCVGYLKARRSLVDGCGLANANLWLTEYGFNDSVSPTNAANITARTMALLESNRQMLKLKRVAIYLDTKPAADWHYLGLYDASGLNAYGRQWATL